MFLSANVVSQNAVSCCKLHSNRFLLLKCAAFLHQTLVDPVHDTIHALFRHVIGREIVAGSFLAQKSALVCRCRTIVPQKFGPFHRCGIVASDRFSHVFPTTKKMSRMGRGGTSPIMAGELSTMESKLSGASAGWS